MLEKIRSFYKDNDEEVFAVVYLNDATQYFETHFYDGSIKEEPPVAVCKRMPDAIRAAEEWCS